MMTINKEYDEEMLLDLDVSAEEKVKQIIDRIILSNGYSMQIQDNDEVFKEEFNEYCDLYREYKEQICSLSTEQFERVAAYIDIMSAQKENKQVCTLLLNEIDDKIQEFLEWDIEQLRNDISTYIKLFGSSTLISKNESRKNVR